jgi:hypothetical protein
VQQLVKVKMFGSAMELELFLNDLANDPNNRWNMEFLTEVSGHYTGTFYYQAPAAPVAPTYGQMNATTYLPSLNT